MYDEQEKLVNTIEARKQRDEMERVAARNKAISELAKERDTTIERLQNDGIGLSADIKNKLIEVEKEYQAQKIIDDARYAKFNDDLADGKLHHVWIDPQKEKLYNEAKKIWDIKVDEAAVYKRFPDEQTQKMFHEKYGNDVLKELINETNRQIAQKQLEDQQFQAEREKRSKFFEEQDKARLLAESQAGKKLEYQKSSYRITEDLRPKEPVDHKLEELKIDKRLDTDELQRAKEKKINPVEKSSAIFDQLQSDQQAKTIAKEQEETDKLLRRIEEDTERAREKAKENPVDKTGSLYLKLKKKFKDRQNDQGW